MTVTEFHPQTNKQAYLAYAVGLITDPSLLPEPRTAEEYLLREYCLNGSSGGGGGIVLPALENPASGFELLEGYDAIDENGNVIYGNMEDNSRKRMQVQVDLESGTASVPRGFHDGITGVYLDIEETTVTPNDQKQEIVPSDGAVLGKVIVYPAEVPGGDDFAITDASYLFYQDARCSNMTELLARIKNCTNMSNMFAYSSGIKNLDLSSLNTSEVKNMNAMFASCTNVATLDISNFDTAKVTDMNRMFSSVGKNAYLKILDLSHFDTSNVTTMQSMFESASSLETIVVDNFDTANVTNMGSMFSGCNALVSPLNLSNWDTGKVNNMGNIFYLCFALESITGFSATNKAGLSIYFPRGSVSQIYALKRLTFRTDLPEGTYSIRSAINIQYCNFLREGMVEMFNTLPDVSTLGLSSSYTTITITGNPCVLDSFSLTAWSGVSVFNSYEELRKDVSKRYRGLDYQNAPVRYMPKAGVNNFIETTFGEITPEMFEDPDLYGSGVLAVGFLSDTVVIPEEHKLSEADKLIATNKGWTIVT